MKKGISLIVLVITIIVMIILAASVVITLSNTGVINRASEAVDLTNEAAVQDIAALTWADAYMDNLRGQDLVDKVVDELEEQGITEVNWNISVTDTGVTVTSKNSSSTTLGSLIKGPEDYGKTVDYTVIVDGTTYTDWQVFYEDEEQGYVFLATKEIVGDSVELGETPVTTDIIELYSKFQVGNREKYTLTNNTNSKMVAWLVSNYSAFANTQDYGDKVIGAIGSPTIELITAGYNAKHGSEDIIPMVDLEYYDEEGDLYGSGPAYHGGYGYFLNSKVGGQYSLSGATQNDGVYFIDNGYWLAAPSARAYYYPNALYVATISYLDSYDYWDWISGVRPVVCLKSSIPATVGTITDFSIIK